MQTKTFSPKELADAVGVSESSIKRWSDAGLIETMRTAGGHRRIGRSEAFHFIRTQSLRLLHPDVLGMPHLETPPPEARTEEAAEDILYEALKAGQAARARGLITSAYLAGADLARLFDGPVAGALNRLGALWLKDEQGIYQEHIATGICIAALHEVRSLMPLTPDGAPVALGGAPEYDPYLLPGIMVATLLADAGYETLNLGPQTPPVSFHHAVADHQPRLVWIAVAADLTEESEAVLIREVAVPLQQQGIEVVVGGRGVERRAAAWPPSIRVLRSMEELAAWVKAG